MNKTTYDFRDLVQQSGLSERNVRYYLYELIPESERVKGSQRYPKTVRDKIVFVGKLREQTKQHRVRLSLEGIKEVLENAAKSIEAVADGNEPLEIFKPSASSVESSVNKIDKVLARGEGVLEINSKHVEKDRSAKSRPTGSAKDYIHKLGASFSSAKTSSGSKQKSKVAKSWQSVQLGDNVELRVRGSYSQKTLDQLALLGQFVDSILKEDKNNG